MMDSHERERIHGAANLANAILDICRDFRERVRPVQADYLASVGHTWETAAALNMAGRASLEAGWRAWPGNPANKPN